MDTLATVKGLIARRIEQTGEHTGRDFTGQQVDQAVIAEYRWLLRQIDIAETDAADVLDRQQAAERHAAHAARLGSYRGTSAGYAGQHCAIHETYLAHDCPGFAGYVIRSGVAMGDLVP